MAVGGDDDEQMHTAPRLGRRPGQCRFQKLSLSWVRRS